MSNRLARLDESTAHIVATHQTHLEGQAGFVREPKCRRVSRVRNRNDDISIGGALPRQRAALRLSHLVDIASIQQAVGSCEVDVFEHASLRWRRREGFYRSNS